METFLLLRRTHRRERVFLDRTLEYLDDIDPVSRCGFPGRVSQKLINDADPIVRRPTYKSCHSHPFSGARICGIFASLWFLIRTASHKPSGYGAIRSRDFFPNSDLGLLKPVDQSESITNLI